ENLKVTCALSGTPVSEDDAWESLVKIGLGGREDLPTKVLSQGQKRRVALARMLLSKAPLWILDEPFTALDVKAVAELEDVIATHLDNEGMVVLTTHQAIKHLAGRETILDLSSREATA
ncbi:MAG: ATP-binding cassette domain-containing protein, partial [Candidatus Heimdallarchaeota archaeon]|nr:ATP-binding cassette domain-containing protein [Candidatus Heimdallarchaeota archaeon]